MQKAAASLQTIFKRLEQKGQKSCSCLRR